MSFRNDSKAFWSVSESPMSVQRKIDLFSTMVSTFYNARRFEPSLHLLIHTRDGGHHFVEIWIRAFWHENHRRNSNRWIDKLKTNTCFHVAPMNFFSRANAHVIGNHRVLRICFGNFTVHIFSIGDGSTHPLWCELFIVRVCTMPQFPSSYEEWCKP